MKNIDQKKLQLFNIFINDMPRNLKIKEARELLGNPFFLFDISLKLYIASDYEIITDKFLKKVDNSYYIEPGLFNQILTDDDLKFLQYDEVLLKKYNDINQRLMIKRISDGQYTLGYVCIFLLDESFINEDKELLTLGTKALSHDLQIKGVSYNIDQIVFKRILDGSLESKEEINDALDKIDFSLDNNIRLMVIQTKNNQKTSYEIKNIHNTFKYFYYKDNICCFVDRRRDMVNSFLNTIKSIIKDNECTIGISGLFDDLSELPTVYSQAIEAIEIGRKYDPNDTIYFYGDYRIIAMFKSQKKENLEKAIDRRLKKVIQYDLENKTTYYLDLKAYFDSGRKINKTAELLFVHKNSIYYRLEKIKTLFDIDIEDENSLFMIELSIKIMNLLKIFKE